MSWQIKDVTDLSKKVAKKPWIIYAAAGAALLGLVVLLRGSERNSTETLSLPAGEDTGGSSGGTDYSYVSEVNEALSSFGTEVSEALAAQSEAVNAVLSGVIQQSERVSGSLEDIAEENDDLWDAIQNLKKSGSSSSSSVKSSSYPSGGGSTGNENQNDSVVEQMKQNSLDWHTASESEKQALHDANVKLGQQAGFNYDSSSGTWSKDGKRVY